MKGLYIPKYDHKGVKGKIYTLRGVIILSFGTTAVKGIMNLMTHSKCLNVTIEPDLGYSENIAYGVLKLGRGKLMFASEIIV